MKRQLINITDFLLFMKKTSKLFVRNNCYFKKFPRESFIGKIGELQSEKRINVQKPAARYVAKKCYYRPSFRLPPMEEDLYISKDHDSSTHFTDQSSENIELDDEDN